jgi:hypothetical protein
MRMRKVFIILGVSLGGLIIASAALPWPRTRAGQFTREKFDHIQRGMTSDEVKAILGPPADYTTVPFFVPGEGITGVAWTGSETERRELPYDRWFDDSACIWVGYDYSDNVVYAHYYDNLGRQRGILSILLDGFKDQLERWYEPPGR